MPLFYEAGTANMLGIAALSAGVDFVLREGLPNIRQKRTERIERLVAGLSSIPDVIVHASDAASRGAGILSFNVDGVSPEEVAYVLEQSFGIVVRSGLHCAPLIHETLGSYPAGSVRVSPSCFTTVGEIDRLVEAVEAAVRVGVAA